MGSFNHGSMANALPFQAIVAQAAYPRPPSYPRSLAMGFPMLMEMSLPHQQKFAGAGGSFFKNESLAFVNLEQTASGFLIVAPTCRSPDFAKSREALGVLGLQTCARRSS